MFNKILQQPIYQGLIAISLMLILSIIVKASGIKGALGGEGLAFWEFIFSVLLAFMMFNTIFSLQSDERMQYFRNSIFTFMGVALIGGCLAYLFSGIKLNEAGSFKWLYIVFTFVYLVFISIVNLMRKIMDYAKKQDHRLRGEK